jgi:hypothetical protein
MKKFLPYILIGAMIITAFGAVVKNAKAEDAATSTEAVSGTDNANQLPAGISGANCYPGVGDVTGTAKITGTEFDVTKCIAYLSFWVIYWPSTSIIWFGGQILDGSVHFSLDGKTFDSELISNGWTFSRDFANMFFIFILLYIAIATILQLSGYGMKDLLVKIIIIALLVNFSLLICHVIIDASNILALEFYNNMTTKGGDVTTALFGSDARSISGAFLEGFNPQKILSPSNFDKWQAGGGGPVLVIVIFLMGALMNIVGAFILFAGAVLFIIRIAVLWLIMLLAPLAFLAMVLPATSQYAKDWWTKLFHQAFFAPAFLFLFYLLVRIIYPGEGKVGVLGSMLGSLAQNTERLNGLNAFFASIATIVIYFIIMCVLMVSCLIVAQKMGAYGAGTVMGWGQRARGWAQGYAGGVARRTAVARPARALAESRVAEKLAARFPKMGGAMLKTLQRGAKVGGLDKITEQRVATGMTLPPEQRAKYLENLGKGLIKGKYVGVDKRSQEEMFKKMSARERVELLEKVPEFKPTYDNLIEKLPIEEKEKTEKVRKEIERKTIVKGLSDTATSAENFRENVKQIRPEEIADLKTEIFRDKSKVDAMIDNFSGAHIKKIMDRGDEATDAFFSRMAMLGDTTEEVAKRLEQLGNRSAAAFVRGPAGKEMLDSYDMGKVDTTTPEGRQREIDKATRRGLV